MTESETRDEQKRNGKHRLYLFDLRSQANIMRNNIRQMPNAELVRTEIGVLKQEIPIEGNKLFAHSLMVHGGRLLRMQIPNAEIDGENRDRRAEATDSH